ncbi:MAG: HAD-IA family hydrolase [Candidatus Roizmanbacteria bacterium]|nr:HAD-IA family hydrolase [Candidatus Roizmanbacteria bacterium]
MITALLSDFSKVLLFVKDKTYGGKLNALNRQLIQEKGDYPFFNYFELNTELLDFYALLKKKYSISLNIFTTGTVQERPELQPYLYPLFENVFSANNLEIGKENSQSYVVLAKRVNAKPQTTIYIDDKQSNLDAAQRAGMNTVLYVDAETARKQILRFF